MRQRPTGVSKGQTCRRSTFTLHVMYLQLINVHTFQVQYTYTSEPCLYVPQEHGKGVTHGYSKYTWRVLTCESVLQEHMVRRDCTHHIHVTCSHLWLRATRAHGAKGRACVEDTCWIGARQIYSTGAGLKNKQKLFVSLNLKREIKRWNWINNRLVDKNLIKESSSVFWRIFSSVT